MEKIEEVGIQIAEATTIETPLEDSLTPQTIAEALSDLIEEDEFEDIANCEDTQDAIGAAYTILMSIYEDNEDQVNAILVERGITEPE